MRLDLSGNQLTSLAGLEALPQLKWLAASGNALRDTGALRALSDLRVLHCAVTAPRPPYNSVWTIAGVYLYKLRCSLLAPESGHPCWALQYDAATPVCRAGAQLELLLAGRQPQRGRPGVAACAHPEQQRARVRDRCVPGSALHCRPVGLRLLRNIAVSVGERSYCPL